MSILKKITTILFILCITGVSNAYPEAWGQINFSYISINDGLSQSTVFSIAQDKLGNMWFATYDGINKYDGYTFTVYQHDENDRRNTRREQRSCHCYDRQQGACMDRHPRRSVVL